MSQACPINFTVVDSTVGRIISLITAAIVVIFFVTNQLALLLFLGADLLFRLLGYKEVSIIYLVSKKIKQIMKLPTANIDGGAKQVAGFFGLLFIFLLIIGAVMNFPVMVTIVAAIYVGCLLMDTLINFCLGCKMYYLYQMLK